MRSRPEKLLSFCRRGKPRAQPFLVDPELQIRVFQLKNIDATDAARIVRQLYGEAINPVVDERTNSLVCKDAPSVVEEVEALLLQLDSTVTKATDLPTSAPPVDDLRNLYGELEQRTQELAAKLRNPAHNSAPVKQLEAELRETVRKAFEARQKLQRAEHAEFAQRLQAVRQSIETRERISQQIIDRRVEELLNPDLRWAPSGGNASARVTTTDSGKVIELRGRREDVNKVREAIEQSHAHDKEPRGDSNADGPTHQ